MGGYGSAVEAETDLGLQSGALANYVAGEITGSEDQGGLTLVDFINISRRVRATYPGDSVKAWWQTRRHNKRLAPIDLLRRRRLRDRIFAAYGAELHCNGQAVSQLVPARRDEQTFWIELGDIHPA